MPRSLRIPLLLLIVGSLCFGLFLWSIETGIGHVPYDRTDSLGHPMGFNFPFFWAMAHSAWVLVSLVAIVVLFLAQRQLAWRTLRQATGRSGPH